MGAAKHARDVHNTIINATRLVAALVKGYLISTNIVPDLPGEGANTPGLGVAEHLTMLIRIT